jgi:subtilisin family serine protease
MASPGEYVITTFPGGTFASASGTSFSSPLVAGTVALMLNFKPGLNQSSSPSALSHAIPLTPDLHHGRLDVYQAISALQSGSNWWDW